MQVTRLVCRVLPTLCMLLFLSFAFAQTKRSVSGKVVGGTDKKPVAGATVQIKGTRTATSTDGEGTFTIQGVDDKSVLVISYVGFQTYEIPVGSTSNISAELKPMDALMSELVVVGYTSQRKKDLTGAVTVVNVADMNKQPAPTITDQLQGQAAGVTITTSGSPGEPPRFRIRGFNTFGDNSPLFVVDGVPTGNINDINPNDIASMQILKDAGAASIYGARASNGVVILTTKRGKGKAKISYDGYYGTQNPNSKNPYELLNPQEQADLKWLALKNTAARTNEQPVYADALYGNGATPRLPDYILPLGKMEGDPAVDPSLYYVVPNYGDLATYNKFYRITKANKSGTDWMDEIFDPAPIQSHNINVSGGNDQGNYLFSASYFDQKGTLLETYNKRFTLRSNSQYNIRKNIRIGENLSYSIIDNPRITILDEGNAVSMAYRQQPIVPVYDIMGNYAGTFGGQLGQATNPVAARQRTASNKGFGNRLFGNAYAEVDFLKNFTFRTSFGGEYYAFSGRWFNYPTYENAENGNANSYSENSGTGYEWTWTNTVTYTKSFGDHNVKILAGTEAINSNNQYLEGNTTDYFSFDPDYTTWESGSGTATHRSSRSSVALYSLFGRVDYNYKGKYLAGFTLRRDGSSKFGPENKYGVFPAGSLGWRVSDENFMKGLTWLDDLKLRGSYGIMGNQLNLSPNSQFTTYRSDRNSTFYDINGTSNSLLMGFRQGAYGNPNAKWESDAAFNIGFDATIKNRLFEISADYYVKQVYDMLFNPTLPGTAGAAAPPYVNVAEMRTSGLDITVGSHFDVAKDWQFDITGTFTSFNNEILKIAEGQDYFTSQSRRFNGQDIIRNEEGHEMSSYYGYKIVGFWNTQAEIDAANELARKTTGSATAVYQTDAAVGRFRYDDKGAGIVTPDSRQFLGSPNPDFSYGLNLGVAYKAFDLSAFFYGVSGVEIWNQVRWWTDFYPSFAGGKSKTAMYNSWTPENHNAKAPIVENAASFSTNSTPNSYYVEDGSYLRLKNLQIGYTLNHKALDKAGISRLRFYVQAANLFTITKYTGLDPEIGGGDSGSFGVDEGAYPAIKQFLFGLNLSF